MDDDKGSGILSFWPPTIALVQALMMKIFGLTPLGICIQSSVVGTVLMGCVCFLCRVISVPSTGSIFASVAIFALWIIERQLMQVRMENLTTVTAVAFACLLFSCATIKKTRQRLILLIVAGFVSAVGMFCYYPLSPFLALGCAVCCLPILRNQFLTSIMALALGALPIIVAAGFWIIPHWDLFRQQVLEAGEKHYISMGNIFIPFTSLAQFSQKLLFLQTVEKWSIVALSLWVLVSARVTARLKLIAVICLVFSLPMFIYPAAPAITAGVFGIVLLFALATECESSKWKLCCQLLVIIAVGKVALIGFTASWQRDGRRYDVVREALSRAVPSDVPIAISQRAWLALRSRTASTNLHLLVHSGASLDNASRMVRHTAADDYFQYLVLEKDRLALLRQLYPWLNQGIATGKFVEQEAIAPRFKPLPWAERPSYELIVYRRGDSPAARGN